MKAVFAIAITAMLTGGAAAASNMTGNKILEVCTSADLVDQGICAGYIIGLIEGTHYGALQAIAVEMRVKGIPAPDNEQLNRLVSLSIGFCYPPEIQVIQIRDVAINYRTDHPATRHNTARSLILTAWSETFPCE